MVLAQGIGPDEVRVGSKPYVAPTAAVLRAQANLVEVGIVVRDEHGNTIGSLKQADFTIEDNGKPQQLNGFTIVKRVLAASAQAGSSPASSKGTEASTSNSAPQPAQPPRFVALYFDDVHTLQGDLRRTQLAAEGFIRNGLTAGDRVAIFTSSSSQTLDFTDGKERLIATIEQLKSRPRMSENGLAVCPRIAPYQAYLIVIGDHAAFEGAHEQAIQCNCRDVDNDSQQCYQSQDIAIRNQAEQTWDLAKGLSQNTLGAIEGVVEFLAKEPGTRTLVLASSGFLSGQLEQDRDRILDEALRAGVVINTLDAKGLYAESPGPKIGELSNLNHVGAAPAQSNFDVISLGDRLSTTAAAMADFSEATGGRYFHNDNDLGEGYRELAAAPDESYLLAFSPQSLKPDGSYDKLKVQVSAPGHFVVQARPGYFAPTKEAERQPAQLSKLDAAVLALDEVKDVPVSVTSRAEKSKSGAPALSVQVHVDLHGLPFQQQKDRHVQKFMFVVALFDAQGNFVTGKEGDMNLALKDASLARLTESGINAGMVLDAAPGAYRLRVVVQETVEGKLSASSAPVEIR